MVYLHFEPNNRKLILANKTIKKLIMKNQNSFSNQNSTIGKSSFPDLFKLASRRLLLAFCIFLIALKVSAQEVGELNNALSGNDSEVNRLRSLVNDIQPTLIFQQNEVIGDKVEAPVLIDADVASVNQLYINNPKFNRVEIVRIRINSPEDLNLVLDISKLESFTNLKYIYFLCAFDICEGQPLKSNCEIGKILKMITSGGNSKIKFFYEISIPS
jgi:hypothetical protein